MRALAARIGLVVVLAGAAALVSPGLAGASFPGLNGYVVYTNCDDGPSCDAFHVWETQPPGQPLFPKPPAPITQGRPVYIQPGPLFRDPAGIYDDDPAFSADGREVAARRCTEAGASLHCGIAVINAQGYELKQLTPMDGSVDDDLPAFSPDGKTLAFVRDSEIWAMAADGTKQRQLTSGPDDSYPDFSPDGTTIAFARAGEIWLMDAAGTHARPLTSDPNVVDDAPSFSPDGSQVAFDSCPTNGDPCEIDLIRAQGSGRHRLIAPSSGSCFEPAFSPDGTRIMFIVNPMHDVGGTLASTELAAPQPPGRLTGDAYRPSWGRLPSPSIETVPQVIGDSHVGHLLVVQPGATPWGGHSVFHWMRCDPQGENCSPSQSQTSGIYVATNADIGHTIRALQVTSNEVGSASRLSSVGPLMVAEPGVRLGRIARVSRGLARVRVRTPAEESCPYPYLGIDRYRCVVDLRLTAKLRSARTRRRTRRIGRRQLGIQAASTRIMRVRVRRAVWRKLLRSRRLRARAVAVATDMYGNTATTHRTLILRLAWRHRSSRKPQRG